MPHIFPRRFLRTRDIVTPEGLNDDIHPVYDALSGRLDRTNFGAEDLSSNLRPHPDSELPTLTGASVSQGAYYNIHSNKIESKYRFYTVRTSDDYVKHPKRVPPNFVKLDGVTTRWTHDGSVKHDFPPSIVPNNGAWDAVKNEDLSGPQQLTFTTGRSKIWISAYLQYVWQGFYEYKSPYIPGTRKYKGLEDLNTPDPGQTYAHTIVTSGMFPVVEENKFLAFDERQILNFLGPAENHEHLSTATTINRTSNVITSSAEYAFPLNEMPVFQERARPNRCGFHHISQGYYPCMVQFALRVDGKIIEETITGKKLPFEESAHGLTVTDSIRKKEEDEMGDDEDFRHFFPFFTTQNTVFGQRSATVKSSFGDSNDSRPGQKVRSSRAVSCGPEVMPIRIGAVVEVQPGTHTIEIVARRLQRKAGKFLAGDFVGVFSRRILAFDLPVTSQRNDVHGTDFALTSSATVGGNSVIEDVDAFKAEDRLTRSNISDSRRILASEMNELKEQNLDSQVLSHEYLPSKVTFHRSVTIKPDLDVSRISGHYRDFSRQAYASAIFAGFTNPRIDSEVSDPNDGWTRPGTWLASDRAGWYPIQTSPGSSTSASDDGNILKIQTSDTASTYPEGHLLRPNEIIIAMMDVELRAIEPLNSEAADQIYGAVDLKTAGLETAVKWRNFGNYLLTERYLDLFALFAIGYVSDGTRIIASQDTPALVNSYNWVNRTPFFNSGPKAVIPFSAASSHLLEPWDIDPGWENYSVDERRSLFVNDYAGDTPRLLSRGGNLSNSNLGISIPIMTIIENNTDSDKVITEYAGYAATMVPSDWTSGYGPGDPRYIGKLGEGQILPGHWATPVGGRNILSGCRVHFGNSRLTIIKTWK
tara:strand:+ start:470 stop:3082 length:2613 start_codon:yes stop_codon:yes gene_type:complete